MILGVLGVMAVQLLSVFLSAVSAARRFNCWFNCVYLRLMLLVFVRERF